MSQIPYDHNDTKAPRKLLALLACAVFAVTTPAIAWCQISVSAMPEHARASRFGGGGESVANQKELTQSVSRSGA